MAQSLTGLSSTKMANHRTQAPRPRERAVEKRRVGRKGEKRETEAVRRVRRSGEECRRMVGRLPFQQYITVSLNHEEMKLINILHHPFPHYLVLVSHPSPSQPLILLCSLLLRS